MPEDAVPVHPLETGWRLASERADRAELELRELKNLLEQTESGYALDLEFLQGSVRLAAEVLDEIIEGSRGWSVLKVRRELRRLAKFLRRSVP